MRYDAVGNLSGTVDKIIKPLVPGDTEKAQISIHTAAEPDQKIRIPNTFTDARNSKVALKQGALVHLTVRPKPL